jgi:type IV pilus assembly protein PilE
MHRHASMRRRVAHRGFTLIELMITVAIVAILASVALPAFTDQLRRGQVVEASTVLSDYRIKMEQYYQDNRGYGTLGATTCANAASAPTWTNFSSHGAKYFTFSCALGSATDNQSYVITASGSAGRAVGHVYTVGSNGDRRTTKFKGADLAPAKSCWVVKQGDC